MLVLETGTCMPTTLAHSINGKECSKKECSIDLDRIVASTCSPNIGEYFHRRINVEKLSKVLKKYF